jgi:hypothetical protein
LQARQFYGQKRGTGSPEEMIFEAFKPKLYPTGIAASDYSFELDPTD